MLRQWLVLCLWFAPVSVFAADKPNFLWLIAEDFGVELGCYGCKEVLTPNLDGLASQGVRYQNMFVTCPVCSPSRSAFMTGMYQTTIGAHNHRSHRDDGYELPGGVRLLSDWMREAGYFTVNVRELPTALAFRGTAKTDWNFTVTGKPFDSERWADLKAHQPFFAQINFQETHRRFNAPKQTDPARVTFPPYYPDHPVTRADWAAYLDSAMELDRKVGLVLNQLQADGLADRTVVVFFADNGQAHVRGKQFCYDSGLHVPLIIRWPKGLPPPKQFQPQSVDQRLIAAIDLAPTMLTLGGAKKPLKMQGSVFLGDAAEPPRQYVFGARDRCDETVFRFRTVRDARYRYIRNFTPERPFLQANQYKENSYPVWNLLKELHAAGKLTPLPARLCAPSMPEEELYDLERDPHETTNLAASPDHAEVRQRLKRVLEEWIESSNDQGKTLEPAELAARRGVTKPGTPANTGYALAEVASKPAIVGLIPKATKPITLDGKLDEWDGAFVTPVHVGHPDWANRGGEFAYLWDHQNLYIGQRCLDQKPAHVGAENQLWNGDSVEFYLDTRSGRQLGTGQFGPGTLHMFFTPFTGTDVKPRFQVRDLPAFKDFKLQGAEVAGQKTPWGYTAEFRLPWSNFPNFKPAPGTVIGIDCELCSSDGGPRVDRTFVYSSPASVGSPASFGKVELVEGIDPAQLKPLGRALLPLSLSKSANYDWLYGTVCVSPTIAKEAARIEGKLLDAEGKVRKTSTGKRETLAGSGFVLWQGAWELFDLPAGTYTLGLTAFDDKNNAITSRTVKLLHGDPRPAMANQQPSPMVEHARSHPRLKEERPAGRREELRLGTLFLPEGLRLTGQVPLFIHFHGGSWLPEAAAAKVGNTAAISVQRGSGSAVYAEPFTDPDTFRRLLQEAESKAGVRFGPITLTAWSAGYGAVREILRQPEHYQRVDNVLLIDGLHTSYVTGRPGPLESQLVTDGLSPFVQFARDASAGRKRLLITHSEIFPGTFASTTETADYLLGQLGLTRKAVLQWGPMGTQQLSEGSKGSLSVLGFAGNSAPDHVDQLHALPEWLTRLFSMPG
jgi:arylsulfatase A-like enzyme